MFSNLNAENVALTDGCQDFDELAFWFAEDVYCSCSKDEDCYIIYDDIDELQKALDSAKAQYENFGSNKKE